MGGENKEAPTRTKAMCWFGAVLWRKKTRRVGQDGMRQDNKRMTGIVVEEEEVKEERKEMRMLRKREREVKQRRMKRRKMRRWRKRRKPQRMTV